MSSRSAKRKARLNHPEGKKRAAYYSFAAVLDIMGSTSELNQVSTIPTEHTALERFQGNMEKIIKRVSHFRELVNEQIKEIDRRELKGVDQSRFYSSDINYRPLSDSILLNASLSDKNGLPPIDPLYFTLRTLCKILLLTLPDQIPVRGAVCVNVAMDFEEFSGEFYGPALAQAFKLESKCTGWPRVTIHKSVISYWIMLRSDLKKMMSSDQQLLIVLKDVAISSASVKRITMISSCLIS